MNKPTLIVLSALAAIAVIRSAKKVIDMERPQRIKSSSSSRRRRSSSPSYSAPDSGFYNFYNEFSF